MNRSRLSKALLATTIATCIPLAVPAATSAATSLTIRGTVVCGSSTEKVVGVWVQSSGGGSNFANWQAYPNRPHVATYDLTFTTSVTTSIYLNVGCGGTAAKWGRSARTPVVKAGATAKQVFLNPRCPSGSSTCTVPPNRNAASSAPSTNWFGSVWCTYRAAEFWKRMVGAYPNWKGSDGRTGDAGVWDDRAASIGWKVEGVPMPDSLVIWQPSGAGSVGHVGYVADVRVYNGVLQYKMYDRNADGKTNNIDDRNGVWLSASTTMKFIVVPPRADSIAR